MLRWVHRFVQRLSLDEQITLRRAPLSSNQPIPVKNMKNFQPYNYDEDRSQGDTDRSLEDNDFDDIMMYPSLTTDQLQQLTDQHYLSKSKKETKNAPNERQMSKRADFNENDDINEINEDDITDDYIGQRRTKRNPRCLHTCLKRGLLHPAQCHMLC